MFISLFPSSIGNVPGLSVLTSASLPLSLGLATVCVYHRNHVFGSQGCRNFALQANPDCYISLGPTASSERAGEVARLRDFVFCWEMVAAGPQLWHLCVPPLPLSMGSVVLYADHSGRKAQGHREFTCCLNPPPS